MTILILSFESTLFWRKGRILSPTPFRHFLDLTLLGSWSFLLYSVLSLSASIPMASAQEATAETRAIEWKMVGKGIATAEYKLGNNEVVFSKPVVLLRVDPNLVKFRVVQELEGGGASVRTMTRQVSGIAGINANFFDEAHQPLGLVVSEGKQLHSLQRGGSVLTGVFLINKKGVPSIIHRDEYDPKDVQLAIQAGPRLLNDGRLIQMKSGQDSSRRSGVAITKDGKILLYATVLRFPGTSFEEVSKLLLDPQLGIRDALNLDGGGSSQLFIEGTSVLGNEIFVHGGDSVPVGLIVSAK